MNPPTIDLIIGLVAPIGTDLPSVTKELDAFFQSISYGVHHVRLSKWFKTPRKVVDSGDSAAILRHRMDAGDALRRLHQRKDIVATVAAAQIKEYRDVLKTKCHPYERVAIVIRQLKTPEEIATLRRIYGNRLLVISCHSSRRKRVDNLTRRLADLAHEIQVNRFRSDAESLILRDEQDQGDAWGQNVRKAFPDGDVFIAADDSQSLTVSVRRALEIVFNHPFHTPTREEYGMYQAESAALRSSALGRQVGAVITTTEGDIVSVGTNEVPKSGGGLYWEGDCPDQRDFIQGVDSNDKFKQKVLGEIVRRLINAKWLKKKLIEKQSFDELIDKLLYRDHAILSGAQIDNIIEFGRCVHAEMAAIVDAARRGVAINNCVLFTTTFPCHECARHIVAAGINKVIYRVPYPKSLVRELYPDSIDVDSEFGDNSQVTFKPFVGIAPRRYMQFFKMRDKARKDAKGNVKAWNKDAATLNLGDYFPTNSLIEADERELVADAGLGKSEQ